MMKKGLLILCFIMIFTDAFSQRIPFGFWNRGQRDTVILSVPVLKSPVDGATDVDQEPILDWDGVIYATHYVVQLSADTGFSSIAWEHDTTSSKAGVTLGLARGTEWYWRVLAYNQFDTSDWSGAWSFTVTTGPPLTAPTLKLPTDGTTGTIQSPTLVWDAVINADNYTVELSNSTSFASPYWLKNVENTSAIIDSVLDYSTTWYWRATAYNDFDTSEASDTFSFTTLSSPLTAPTLLTPTDGAIDQTQSPYLTWSRVDSAGFYAVQISQSEMFSEVPWNANTFDTVQQITAGLLEGTQWYWRVRSINSDTSAWSEVFTFKVTEGTPTARAYYIDATSGKDEYNGRATDQAWKTLDKVSSFSFIAGDTILLKGGETYSGQIKNRYTHDDTVNAVTYGSYGTGKAKILLTATDSIGISVEYTKHIKVNISNIIIEGLYNPLTQTGGSTNTQKGIFVWNYTTISPLDSNRISQVNINNCQISKVKDQGIQIVPNDFGKTLVCKLDSNLIYDIGLIGISMNYNWHSNSKIRGNTVRNIYGRTGQVYTIGININMCKDIDIERNLVYDIGYHSVRSGVGIITGASRNIRVRYNEIYNIISNTLFDGEGIDFENGSDSCLAEFNYIHDIPGTAMLISGSPLSLPSIQANYKAYITERGSLDSGSCDYNVVRYNIIKNFGNSSQEGFAGIFVTTEEYGKNNQVYNNTIIHTSPYKTNKVGIAIRGHSDSTKIFNNLVVGDSIAFFWADSVSTHRYSYIQNNMYWGKSGYTQFVRTAPLTVYSTMSGWASVMGYDTAKLRYNPLLNDPYKIAGDTLNNPYLIETLISKYLPNSASMVNLNGVELSSYTRSAPETNILGTPAKKSGYYSIGAFVDTTTTSYAYNIETRKWLGRSDTLQNMDQMKVKDSLITFMKRDTLYTKLDLFYVMANLNEYSSKLNIVRDTFNLTAISNPTFTTNYGFTGNGSTSYLRTGWIPSTSGINFTLNDASASIYSMKDTAEDKFVFGTNIVTDDFLQLNPRNSINLLQSALNQTTGMNVANNNSKGLFTLSRSGSTLRHVYANDTLIYTGTGASSHLSSQQLYILARNYGGGVSSNSTRPISMFALGSNLTELQQHRLTDNFEWYLTAIGHHQKPVKPITTLPLDSDTGVSLNTTFKWENLNNAHYYQLQTSYVSNFASIVGDVSLIDTNQYTAGTTAIVDSALVIPIQLLTNRQYYWRVRGINRGDTTGNGKWSEIKTFFTPSSYEPESLSLFARMTYVPSTERKDLMDSLVKYLKTDTIWGKTDLLYVMAAVDTGNAKFNWINSSYTLANTGTTKAIFTTEKGYKSDGVTGHLRTGWTPSSSAVNYTLNDGSVSFYSQDNIAEGNYVLGCNNNPTKFIQINPRTAANNIQTHLNSDTVRNLSNSNSQGFFSITRSSSADYNIYRNGTLLYNTASVSTALPTVPLAILGTNFGGGYANFTIRTISVVRVGASLSSYSQNILQRRIEWYLNRISAYNFVPSAPILITPHDTATSVSETPYIDWDNVGADYYQIEIDDLPAFATPEYTANTAGSEVLSTVFVTTPVFTTGLTYYWRVRGVNANGTGAWSATYSFTIAP